MKPPATAYSATCRRWLVAWLTATVLLAGLPGCGFHLRGTAPLPDGMSVTYINSAQPYSSLVGDFRAALKMRGVAVTETSSEATAILRILDSETEKRVLSVNTSGKVLEYELRQKVSFSVTTDTNQSLVTEQTVSLSRDYLFSSTDILGKEREDRIVRQTLQRNLVDMAMLRIAAAAR
jgi:LPS-assembly lipoprotein